MASSSSSSWIVPHSIVVRDEKPVFPVCKEARWWVVFGAGLAFPHLVDLSNRGSGARGGVTQGLGGISLFCPRP